MALRRAGRAEPDYALTEVGKSHPEVVAVNADMMSVSCSKDFVEKFPERSFSIGISEQNMVSFAAGLAHEGFVPYIFTMAAFLTMRSCEQIRTDVCYNGLPVRLVGHGAGYSSGISGATHCALEDVALLSTMGGMTILDPCDIHMQAEMLKAAVEEKGPVYIRVGNMTHGIVSEGFDYKIGKAMIQRDGDDGAFLVSGVAAVFALKAAERLEQELGAKIRVVNMHTVKPMDEEALFSAAKTGRIVAAQDHNIIGGIGSLAALKLMQAGIGCKFAVLGCPDNYVPIATPDYLYHVNGYDAEGLYEAMKAML